MMAIPPGATLPINLSKDGWFITMRMSGSVTRGEQTGSSERQTLQFAVPPRISGP